MSTLITFNGIKLNISTDMECNSIQTGNINTNTLNTTSLNTNTLNTTSIQSNTIQSNSLNTSNLHTNNITNTGLIQSNSINLQDNVFLNTNPYLPAGSVVTFAGISAPAGWLICNGAEVSKTVYANPFSAIGNTYGSPVNPSNFVLPNLGERMPIGKSISNNVGDIGGASSYTMNVGNLPAHTHTGTTQNAGLHNHSINDPGHSHIQYTHQDDYNCGGGNPPGFCGDGGYGTNVPWDNIGGSYTGITINNAGDHNHTFTTDATGSNNPIDIRNKFIVLQYIIRY